MSVFAVDLAAKYSAACLLNHLGDVVWQVDSWGRTEDEFLELLTVPFYKVRHEQPGVMAVEDLPHRLPFSSLVKRVARIQGRIVERMARLDCADKVLFVPPAVWRKSYDGLGRGTGPEAVLPVAVTLGYLPPDLRARILQAGDKAIARKVGTDYAAAYLIARWAHLTNQQTGSFDAAGTSRYTVEEQRG